MSVDDWQHIRHDYKYQGRGLREVVIKRELAELASTSPTKVGQTLSLLGVDRWSDKIDKKRSVPKGDTVAMLERVTDRRNRIAHTDDRAGRGRAPLTVGEVREDLASLRSFVSAVEALLG